MYRGFITSLLGLASVFGSMFAAYALGPKLSATILNNQTIVNTLIHYTDASSRLGDLELSQLSVAGIDANSVSEVVSRVHLPEPFGSLLENNILSQVFASTGSVTVAEYINQTIVTAIISVISYVLVFLAAYVALSLVTGLIGYIFRAACAAPSGRAGRRDLRTGARGVHCVRILCPGARSDDGFAL